MNDLVERLLRESNECTLAWVTREGRPAATIVSFVAHEGKIGLTALAGSPRARAIARNPAVSVVVSGTGTGIGHSRCVSIQGHCEIRSDATTRDDFFPRFASAVLRHSEKGAAMMAKMMNSPENLVLVVTPTKTIPYDSHDMFERADSL